MMMKDHNPPQSDDDPKSWTIYVALPWEHNRRPNATRAMLIISP
jgi:hypothetical protein